MGGGQPYLYSSPRYSALDPLDPFNGFNPRAVTQASQMPPSPPRPKQEGPLLNFNRHPDSYLVLPQGRSNVSPMNPNTKSRIKWARKLQLVLRVPLILGAIGMLICVICIRGTKDTEGWILRLPACVDILITVYAIYHLVRSAISRTPQSSASYHFFALIMDTGLIPFYAFTAILGKANFEQAPGTTGRWRSFFNTDDATNQLLHATWLIALIDGGLHLLSFFFDLYLLLVFRKIARLPPDLNPLEDNLTSRRKTKHKYKNSSVSEISDKRFSEITATTTITASSKRASKTSEPLIGEPKTTGMSFFQSRSDLDPSFSPHNPDTARLSKVSLAEQVRASKVDLNKPDARSMTSYAPSRITSAMPANPTMSKRNSVVTTVPVYDDIDDSPDEQSGSKADGNWEVLSQGDEKDYEKSPPLDDYDPYRASSLQFKQPRDSPKPTQSYKKLHQMDTFIQQPLRMNPPTPPPQAIPAQTMNSPLSQLSHRYYEEGDKENDRSHTMTSAVSALSTTSSKFASSNNESSVSPVQTMTTASESENAPKSRFYGDLAAAMRGVRHNGVTSPRPKSMVGSLHNTGSEVSSAYDSHFRAGGRPTSRAPPATAGDKRIRPRSYVDSVTGTVIRKPVRNGDESEEYGSYSAVYARANSPRVISRSGADLMTAGGDLGMLSAGGGNGRREVSGKVAEEGRGGLRSGLFMRKPSGVS